MTDEFLVAEEEPRQDKKGDGRNNGNGGDNTSGFGLVNWMFDHVRSREPIFLHLYKDYDRQLKLSGVSAGKPQKFLGALLLIGCLLFDGIVFLVYGLSVVFIILSITFIFVKGAGVLEYLHADPATHSSSEPIKVQAQVTIHTKN